MYLTFTKLRFYCLILTVQFYPVLFSQKNTKPVDQTRIYYNPVIHADFSDPDVVRKGSDYYLIASSFNCVPGIPILHSKDLVNWKQVNYALPRLIPLDYYAKSQHGKGVWAPCIRIHNNEFYIYYPDPEFGIYMVKSKDPREKWSEPVLVKKGKGLIDPTPLWDDDGQTYLVYAFAGSRAGIKSILVVCTMNKEGTLANNDEVLVFDGHREHPTVEGPKLYKRNGFYYIFAPAGGVKYGWQLVLRSKNIYGPYDVKTVLEQGRTGINGPHQGAWIQTPSGQDWFIHFQDKGAYGRILHLQPMKWINNWPVIGTDPDNDGKGEPVESGLYPATATDTEHDKMLFSDEFSLPALGFQWQWHANPETYWGFPSAEGYYTLFCRPLPENYHNLFDVPNLLLQKFPDEEFSATCKLTFFPESEDEKFGFVVMGLDYSYIKFFKRNEKMYLSQVKCVDADKGTAETESNPVLVNINPIYLRVKVSKGGVCIFSYSENNSDFFSIGESFVAKEGKWIGAKLGFVALRDSFINDAGYARIDWIRFN
ncbi:MAG: glycoside hydrolase 43 family protein [Bacteroidales bacterium]